MASRIPTRRVWIVRVVIVLTFVVSGAIAQALVAWLCAWRAPLEFDVYGLDAPVVSSDLPEWNMGRQPGYWEPEPDNFYILKGVGATGLYWDGRGMIDSIPAECEQYHTVAGWPFRSMRYEHFIEGWGYMDREPFWRNRERVTHAGIRDESWREEDNPQGLFFLRGVDGIQSSGNPYSGVIPLSPIPVGFAANTLLYGGVLVLGVFGVRSLVRRRHSAGGSCPACGYDHAGIPEHAACPECGHTRASTIQ